MNPAHSRPGVLLCLRSLCIRIRIGTHRLKRLLRECHRCRADACHTLAKLVRTDRLQCLRCSVREIMTCTSVKMDIHKPRNQVISPCVQNLFPVRAGRFTPRKTNPCSTVYTSAFLILILNPPFFSDFTSIMVTGKALPHRRQPSHPDASAGWMPALPASPVRRTRVRRYLLCPLPRRPPESFLPA